MSKNRTPNPKPRKPAVPAGYASAILEELNRAATPLMPEELVERLGLG